MLSCNLIPSRLSKTRLSWMIPGRTCSGKRQDTFNYGNDGDNGNDDDDYDDKDYDDKAPESI